MRALAGTINAPGEVTLNLYAVSHLTPRISAQVVVRRAKMGDSVKEGQTLVTLSSVDIAAAQGELILAEQEWQRAKNLGKDVVSAQRYLEAQVGAQQAHAKVLAYGMTEEQVIKLLSGNDATAATGQFDLLSRQDGTVLSDNFVVGQFVEPGDLLFVIGDESRVWVEAQLSPAKAANIEIGAPAWISKAGLRMPGKVVQVHHIVDEITRTLSVRVEIDNSSDRLHAGEFVDVAIETGEGTPMLAVPNAALVLMEGDQVVFALEGDKLHPTSVQTGATVGDWTVIRSGLSAGDEIVIKQAFLLKSLILKSKMGEGHGH
ncbi:MAG: efflux transporter periplasmic adaptor subunit [Cycloclasticus sp.]|nr:MAG: efflux transporter periplasmic adaptor subunit [Cycloclasticus sp.]